jgi:hypothetical protein
MPLQALGALQLKLEVTEYPDRDTQAFAELQLSLPIITVLYLEKFEQAFRFRP